MRRILRVKFRAGLFEHPYVDPAKADAAQLRPDAVAAAREASGRSMVLLKNEGKLPFSKSKKTAVIGPLGDDQHDMLGPWWGRGEDKDVVTVFEGIKEQNPNTTFTAGCTVKNTEPPDNTPSDVCGDDSGFAAAVTASKAADQVVLALGETREQSGEAASRSEIDLPGKQEELVAQIKAATPASRSWSCCSTAARSRSAASSTTRPRSSRRGSPASRPATRSPTCVFGDVNPGGKLPVSFPRSVGQVPIYYNHENTGRPCDATLEVQLALPRHQQLRPAVRVRLRAQLQQVRDLEPAPELVAACRATGACGPWSTCKNVSGPKGDEVVQLYIHDPVASLAQPVRRLRGFERVTLDAAAEARPSRSRSTRAT